MRTRCRWAESSANEKDYHDKEWGVPVHNDRLLFEFLILEGAQAGLSWSTILNKRDNYRAAFDNFDVKKVAEYNQQKVDELLSNSGIVRNRLKINSAISHAKAFIDIQNEYGSFSKFIWSFVGEKPLLNSWRNCDEVPVNTEVSDKMAKELKKRGFKFVGTTICYSFMQATGMVNDHVIDCFRHSELNT